MAQSKRNTKGGKGFKSLKKIVESNRELLYKEEGQEYAQVTALLGDRRVSLNCDDGAMRMGRIRGSIAGRCRIVVGDMVLIGKREFEDGKADVFHKYSAEEAGKLKALKVFQDSTRVGATALDLAHPPPFVDPDDLDFDFI